MDEATRPSTTTGLLEPWPLRRDESALIGGVAIVTLAVTVVSGWLITGLFTGLASAEADVNRWFAARRTPRLNELTNLGSGLSDTITIVIALAVLVPLLVWITRRWNEALLLAGAVTFETSVFVTSAFIVGRDRPPVEQLDVSPPTSGFPSGHTGAAFAFYLGLMTLVFWWTDNKTARTVATVLGGAIPIIVATSRLYRGMHFPTDVVFGAAIGLTAVATFVFILRPDPPERARSS